MKVRQPLRRALVFLPSGSAEILRDVVADELNVDEVDTADELSEVIQFELAPNFKTLGPRLGERAKGVKAALAELDGTEAAEALEAERTISVLLDGERFELGSEDVSLRVRPQQGFAVSREGGEVVALDLSVDDDLRKRGWARDVVRQVQDLRKTSGLDVSDRIILRVVGLDAVADHFEWIAGEVLATDVRREAGEGDGTVIELEDFGDGPQPRVWLEKDSGFAPSD